MPVATITIAFDDVAQKEVISVDPDTISTKPDQHIVFVVLNNGSERRKVSIDRNRFIKKQEPSNAPGPDTPITLFGRHSDHVDPGDVGALILRIRDKDNFGGEPAGRYYLYKYTIEASGLDDKDPDIGINN